MALFGGDNGGGLGGLLLPSGIGGWGVCVVCGWLTGEYEKVPADVWCDCPWTGWLHGRSGRCDRWQMHRIVSVWHVGQIGALDCGGGR